MPLFKCSKCGAMENTALGHFWMPHHHGEPVLCSECHEGKWHGRFPKEDADAKGMIECTDGFIYHPNELEPGGYFYGRRTPKNSALKLPENGGKS